MKLVKADQDTVTIEMTWQDEFEVILNVFSALHKNYDVADYMLHDVKPEEVNALYATLADIKTRFKEGKNNHAPTASTGLQVISANKEKLVLKVGRKKEFSSILMILGAVATRYSISAREIDAELPRVTSRQIFMVLHELENIQDILIKELYNEGL